VKGKSGLMTLLAGDVISTGTPAGVGLGMSEEIRFSRVLLLLALSVFIVGAIQQMKWLARPAYADLR
jgi:2-keto-4-pentenoate hydratase/2-oxohepta-3-ene-1,7-dioic acid hydratase in catechol pathway